MNTLVTTGRLLSSFTKPRILWSNVISSARFSPCVATKVCQGSFFALLVIHPPLTGIGLTLWNVLASGHIRSDAEEQKRIESGENGRTAMGPWLRTPDEKKMCDTLETIAKEVGTEHITAGGLSYCILRTDVHLRTPTHVVAIAYTLHKAPYITPIVGGRKVEHLLANIEALKISLTPDHIARIDGTLAFDKGFPSNLIVSALIHV